MSRELFISQIIDSFNVSAENFTKKSNGVHWEVYSEFKGAEKIENIRYHYAKIYYNSYILLLKYTAHGLLSTVNSILECLVFFEKSNNAVCYPLSTVLDFLEFDSLDIVTIPNIISDNAMEQAFDVLFNTISKYQSRFVDLSFNTEMKAELINKFKNEIMTYYNLKSLSDDDFSFYLDSYYSWITNRSVSPPFIHLLKGDHSKALRKLKKLKNKSGYENRIVDFISENKELNIKSTDASLSSAKELTVIILSFYFLAIAWSPAFLLLYLFFMQFESFNSIYLLGPISNIPFVVLPSLLMGIVSSYFTRNKAIKLLFKKNYKAYLHQDYITNSHNSDKFIKGLFKLLLVVCITITFFMVKSNIKFTDNGFYDNTDFLSLQGKFYSYEQVDKVYYKPNRINGFDQNLEFPSYVIVLTNGEEIDLYEFEEIKTTEKKLIPLLTEKNIKIEK